MPMIKKKLTALQRADLVAAAGRKHGLYQPKKPNRETTYRLRCLKLLAEGPAVHELDRATVLEQAAAALRDAAMHAAAGDFYEAETETWGALRIYKRLNAEELYITEAGREAAGTGYYMEEAWPA